MTVYDFKSKNLNDYGIFNPVMDGNKMANEKIKQLPVKKFRCGNVTATVWKNVITKNNMEVDIFNTTIEKSYKDELGNWKTTNSYGVYELNKVRLVSEEAFRFLSMKEKDSEKEYIM